MNLFPGSRTNERPGRQMATLLALACGCALISNALAGPTRHLAWRAAPPAAPRPPAAAPPPTLPALAPPTAAATKPGPKSDPRPPAPAGAAPKPLRALQDRYPAPPEGAPFEIEDAEAVALHQAGALFLDARRTSIYEEGHIAGARLFSFWEDGLDAKLQVLADATFDFKDPVVIYCSGGDCRDSHLLADRMWPLGYRNLRIFKGGWPAWVALGGPSARGREVVP
jgi:rhodanese-related sulfurtransferase